MATDGDTPRSGDELAALLGVPVDASLLRQALTHRSYAYENGGLPNNERLEFLGDAVLGIVVTEKLYLDHPDLPEGRLAKLRASVVNMRAIADIARSIGPKGLGAYVWLGRGETSTGGRDKSSILADTTEAVIGAVYLTSGMAAAAKVVHDLFDELMHDVAHSSAGVDWKTALQELSATLGLGVPSYEMSATGPDHAKEFTARARVGERSYDPSVGHSKKEAEQGAAEHAWREISAEHTTNPERARRSGEDGLGPAAGVSA